MKEQFKESVIVVTGGGQGIGKAISLDYVKSGAKVIIAEADEEAGDEAAQELREFGDVFWIKTDVSKENEVKELFNQSFKNFGGVDILINNAGIGHFESLFDISTEAFDRVINVNLRGTFLCSKYAALQMKKKGKGAIVNIASTRALMSEPNSESYAASKGGILSLTHAMAVSLGHDGIRVNAISPGWIEVADWKKRSSSTSPIHREVDKLQHPVARVGQPRDIVKAVFYLTSDDSEFITGQNFVIDGGMTVKMIYEE